MTNINHNSSLMHHVRQRSCVLLHNRVKNLFLMSGFCIYNQLFLWHTHTHTLALIWGKADSFLMFCMSRWTNEVWDNRLMDCQRSCAGVCVCVSLEKRADKQEVASMLNFMEMRSSRQDEALTCAMNYKLIYFLLNTLHTHRFFSIH